MFQCALAVRVAFEALKQTYHKRRHALRMSQPFGDTRAEMRWELGTN